MKSCTSPGYSSYEQQMRLAQIVWLINKTKQTNLQWSQRYNFLFTRFKKVHWIVSMQPKFTPSMGLCCWTCLVPWDLMGGAPRLEMSLFCLYWVTQKRWHLKHLWKVMMLPLFVMFQDIWSVKKMDKISLISWSKISWILQSWIMGYFQSCSNFKRFFTHPVIETIKIWENANFVQKKSWH